MKDCFITSPVEVLSSQEEVGATLKQRLRRGASSKLDPRTARLFRYDRARESWQLVDASGWNAQDRYVWGHVDRPGVYAAVALPKDKDALRQVALQSFARRT